MNCTIVGQTFIWPKNNIYFQKGMEVAVEGLLSMASNQATTHSMERALVLEQGETPVIKRVTQAVF